MLDGPNVSSQNHTDLFFTRRAIEEIRSGTFSISLSNTQQSAEVSLKKGDDNFEIKTCTQDPGTDRQIVLRPGTDFDLLTKESPGVFRHRVDDLNVDDLDVKRNRFQLTLTITGSFKLGGDRETARIPDFRRFRVPQDELIKQVQQVLHVPGLRDNPSRTYKTTAVSDRFPGTFDTYVASVIQSWQREGDARLPALVKQLQHMGLTRDVSAERINDTQVELRVAQEPIGSGGDARMINVADVGIGVSQVLPVLVAMLVAEPGQLVYIEQPEIHLHPRAQARLADAIIEASNRGVRVVIETHSQLLLLAIQTRIAEDNIDPADVMLHWFTRDERGVTSVASREPDQKGAFGDWPEDFSEVEMEWQNRYLDAAEKHLCRLKRNH
jgi:uncharacterized protein YciU (UPF0263 family)